MNTGLLRWMRSLGLVLPLAFGGCTHVFYIAGHFDDYSEVFKGNGVGSPGGSNFEFRGERTGLVGRGGGVAYYDKIVCDDGRSASFLLHPYGNGMLRAQGRLSDGTRFTIYYGYTPGSLDPLLESFRHAADARLGVTKDDAEALKRHRKAAEAGDPAAMHALGFWWWRKATLAGGMFGTNENSPGVTKDYGEAYKWYRKSAEAGDPSGMYSLGIMYRDGSGVTKDDAEALKWFRKAAAAGNASGMNILGDLYHEGSGVTKDDAEAVRWYRKAAEAGNRSGMYNLGGMYQDGAGVAKNLTEAVKWYRKAAALGYDRAKMALKSLGVSE